MLFVSSVRCGFSHYASSIDVVTGCCCSLTVSFVFVVVLSFSSSNLYVISIHKSIASPRHLITSNAQQ